MSFALVSVPTILMLGLNSLGLKPMSIVGKKIFEVSAICASLFFAYPISAAIFPPTSTIPVSECEITECALPPDVEEVYFEKGV